MIDKYGPWALIAGGSVGIGAAMAERLAAQGFHLILVGRDASSLQTTATALEGRFGVETRTIVLNLTVENAADKVIAAVGNVEVGLLAYIAGAVPFGLFVDQSPAENMATVQLNALVPMGLCRHFGKAMCDRGRGGIILGGSGVALAGSAELAVYSAAKAFQMMLGESLWYEMRPKGVDVLNLLIHATRTPTAELYGMKFDELADRKPMLPEEVAEEALLNIHNGPTWWAGRENFELASRLCTTDRRAATEFMSGRLKPQIKRS